MQYLFSYKLKIKINYIRILLSSAYCDLLQDLHKLVYAHEETRLKKKRDRIQFYHKIILVSVTKKKKKIILVSIEK